MIYWRKITVEMKMQKKMFNRRRKMNDGALFCHRNIIVTMF